MRPLPVVLSLLALLSPAVPAAEAQVATPFEVRKEAQELLDDLARRTPGAEDAALLERVQRLMARHGARLIEVPGDKSLALPLSDILFQRLRDLSLEQRFITTYATLAEQRLPPVGSTAPEAELIELARAYPATPAAYQAWSRLADQAWDRGHLGAFLTRAQRAGETVPASRAARLDVARRLLTLPPLVPPTSLTGIEEMWRQPLDLKPQPTRAGIRQGQPDGRSQGARVALSRPLGDVICGSDGQRAFVIDQLVGNLQGSLVTIGNSPMLRRQCQPAVTASGFVVAGIQDVQRLTLAAIDREGAVRWRTASPGVGYNPLISPPVVIDQVVAVALVVATDEAADLRIQAYRLADGKPAWDVLVARLAGHRPWMFAGDQAFALIPGLCVQDGRLLILSNSGVIARVGADGDLQRVWTYRSPGTNLDDGMGNNQGGGRLGAIISDGHVAVATPADLPGQALILTGDQAPVIYRGDGAGGEVLAVADGRTFLAGSRLIAVDLAQRRAVWDSALPGSGIANALTADLQAVTGNGTLLVAGRDTITAYDPTSGAVRTRRALERPVGLGVGDQTLVIAAEGDSSAYCAAYGGATSVITRLTTAAQNDPHDIRSVAALAAMAAARDQHEQALAWYDEAFRRGAGAEFAAKAARILRRRLDLAKEAQWPDLLGRFASLGQRDPTLIPELTYWQARQAEAQGDTARALRLYTQVRDQATSSGLITIRDDLAVHLRTLAAGGLHRLDSAQPLPWSPTGTVPLPALARNWQVTARRGRGLMIGGGVAVGYADGVLTANRIADGGEVWWRRPQRPLLGVRSRPEPQANGVAIDIMPGTSAAAAGLLSEDILLTFNGNEINSFTADLIPAVLALTVRAPFTAQVLRAGKPVTISGTLGGEIVEPVAINAQTVLVWPTAFAGTQQATLPGAKPEGLWVAAHDLKTGVERWRHAVPPTTQEESPARPLLTAGDLALLVEGVDLVALPATPPAGVKDVEPVWRLNGQAPLLREARMIGDGLLWLPEIGHDQAHLVAAATGQILATLPIEAPATPLLVGNDLYARHADGLVSAWDLGLGRRRWEVPGITRLAAASGDTLWAINAAGQLVALDRFSGAVRRLYGEWVGVVDAATSADRLYLHVTPTATTHALACLSLAGGALLWQQNLPGDLAALEPSTDGIGCILAGTRAEGQPSEPAAALAFNLNGDLQRLAELTNEPGLAQVWFLPGGLLRSEATGLIADAAVLPAAPPTMPASAAADQLKWQTAGSARYAVLATMGGSYDLFVDSAGEDVRIRLGQLGPFIDAGTVQATLPSDPDQRPELPGTITSERLPDVDGRHRWHLQFQAVTLGWRNGVPLQLRVTTASGSDCPAAPPWLRSAWRTVVPGATKVPNR